jgi:curved DNA-binding protein CbpA
MTLQEAFALFRRLGLDVPPMRRAEFKAAYFRLARRYHPDLNPSAHELMANINAARSTILKSCLPG